MTESSRRMFSQDAWQHVAPTYARITDHPFLVTLADGSLPQEVFARYLLDDAHYLASYARTLALIASRMPTSDGVALLAGSAAGAITAERSLHRGYLEPLGIDADGGEPSTTCRAYTGFLAEHAATSPVEVALAAVLPCFRVYAEVGRHVAAAQAAGPAGVPGPGRQTAPPNPYADWIATYSDPEFDAAVAAVETATDELADASPWRERMLDAYATATRLEHDFWDASLPRPRPRAS